MTTRTVLDFNISLRMWLSDNHTYAPQFWQSESARHDLEDDPSHTGRCQVYSDTLLMRFAGCLEQALVDKYREDWLAGGENINGNRAIVQATQLIHDAIEFFGESFSLSREATIIPKVVENRYQVQNADKATRHASYQALKDTFDDVTLLVQRSVVTVKIDDEPPRMIRPGGTVNLDAPAVLNITAITTTDTSGVLLNFAIPEGFQISGLAVYNAYSTPLPNAPGSQAPTEVTVPIAVNSDDNVIISTHTTAVNAANTPGAGETRREFVGLRFNITQKRQEGK